MFISLYLSNCMQFTGDLCVLRIYNIYEQKLYKEKTESRQPIQNRFGKQI